MLDIVGVENGDIRVVDTQTVRAANIVSTQQGSLYYAPDLGVDLDYFLNSEFKFENESFKSYLIQRLAASSINVSSIIEVLEPLVSRYKFKLTPAETGDALIAR